MKNEDGGKQDLPELTLEIGEALDEFENLYDDKIILKRNVKEDYRIEFAKKAKLDSMNATFSIVSIKTVKMVSQMLEKVVLILRAVMMEKITETMKDPKKAVCAAACPTARLNRSPRTMKNDSDAPELDKADDELELEEADDKPAFDEVKVVKHEVAVVEATPQMKLLDQAANAIPSEQNENFGINYDSDAPELDEADDELELEEADDKPAFDEVKVVKHKVAAVEATPQMKLLENQAANAIPSGQNKNLGNNANLKGKFT
ncbi:hypothetical protein DAPPUDRAFT_258748 [Daphnia pulex]|uniref:Uncharacterized protein n=1 Tax=Daphnia pulex TaxID=6669 RepID=E9HG00_DAPPU|nr:hypothetical protein DAPPUDRAFT_258748 [Daphnia pulex]|eukprot:EFX69345.1 hypothetical protein DAPPUDRAFT_258748 [Daphnia pulex]